jgi:hypothetical protein
MQTIYKWAIFHVWHGLIDVSTLRLPAGLNPNLGQHELKPLHTVLKRK